MALRGARRYGAPHRATPVACGMERIDVLKLYHLPGSRSCRVLWLIFELGLECEIEKMSLADGSLRANSYRELNPLGKAPTLDDAGVVLYESGAIVEYLLERYGAGRLAPAVGSADRAQYLQWLHWGEATLLPPIAAINGNRFVLAESDRSEAALDVARRQLSRVLNVLGGVVANREFLVGDEFSAADIMVGYGVRLAKMVGELPEQPESIHEWHDGLAARAAYQRAFDGDFGG